MQLTNVMSESKRTVWTREVACSIVIIICTCLFNIKCLVVFKKINKNKMMHTKQDEGFELVHPPRHSGWHCSSSPVSSL